MKKQNTKRAITLAEAVAIARANHERIETGLREEIDRDVAMARREEAESFREIFHTIDVFASQCMNPEGMVNWSSVKKKIEKHINFIENGENNE